MAFHWKRAREDFCSALISESDIRDGCGRALDQKGEAARPKMESGVCTRELMLAFPQRRIVSPRRRLDRHFFFFFFFVFMGTDFVRDRPLFRSRRMIWGRGGVKSGLNEQRGWERRNRSEPGENKSPGAGRVWVGERDRRAYERGSKGVILDGWGGWIGEGGVPDQDSAAVAAFPLF